MLTCASASMAAPTPSARLQVAGLARRHRHTAVVARTWLQHALPMLFGLKLLNTPRRALLAGGCGGCAADPGAAVRWRRQLAAPGDGVQVSERLATELAAAPDAWHHRDRIAGGLGVRDPAGTCEIARVAS
jgi:3-carboxy-cis,cis-muconate cycloisomerase